MEVKLTYFSSIIEDESINVAKKQLEKNELSLSLYDRDSVAEMSLEEMISQLYMTLSPALVQTIASGLLTNVLYDSIKDTFLTLSGSVKGKTYKRYYPRGRVKVFNADFGIKFKAGHHEFDLQLPPEMDDQLKEVCIKQAFELIKAEGPEKKVSFTDVKDMTDLLNHDFFNKKDYILKYNEESGELEKIDLLELIAKKREEGTL
ncbi:hypothetical protein ACE1OG_12370 [Aeromonas hydrophila]